MRMRQAVLFCAAALAVLVAAPVAALAHPADDLLKVCRDNGLERGIYPPSNPIQDNIGKFDIDYSSTKAGKKAAPNQNAVSTITGGAIVCGNHDGVAPYTREAKIYLPTAGQLVTRCANTQSSDSECRGQRNAGYNDLQDTWYDGSSTITAYCLGLGCWFTGVTADTSRQRVDYNTKDVFGLFGDKGDDRCVGSPEPISCGESRSQLLGIDCNGDTVYERPGANPYGSTLMLHIYEIHCDDGFDNRQYLLKVEDLVICAWANTAGGTTCGPPNAAAGTNLNGTAGEWTWNLEVVWTDNTTNTATATDNWVL